MTEAAQDEVPLIWTAKGNLPVSTLKVQALWQDNPDNIVFTEQYIEIASGELVKSSTHVYVKPPTEVVGVEQPAPD